MWDRLEAVFVLIVVVWATVVATIGGIIGVVLYRWLTQ